MPLLIEWLHGILQDAVNAVLYGHLVGAGFDVDVTGAAFESGINDRIHQANDRVYTRIARQFVHGYGFFGLLIGDHLEREPFGGLVENALRLLGALQQIANLRTGSDVDD